MKEFRIFVGLGVVDWGEDENPDTPPMITKEIENFLNIGLGSVSTDSTHEFRVPYTVNNAAIFGKYVSWDEKNTIHPNDWQACRFESEGVVIFVGEITIKGVTYENHEPKFFEVQAMGSVVSAKKLLQNLLLNALDLGTATYSETAITNSWSATAATSDIVYPLVNYGQWQTAGTGQESRVTIEEMRPAVYEKNVVEAIFAGIGWTVGGDWITDTEGLKYITLATGKAFNHSPAQKAYYSWEVEQASNQIVGGYVYNTDNIIDWGTVISDPSSVINTEFVGTGSVENYDYAEPSGFDTKVMIRGTIDWTVVASATIDLIFPIRFLKGVDIYNNTGTVEFEEMTYFEVAGPAGSYSGSIDFEYGPILLQDGVQLAIQILPQGTGLASSTITVLAGSKWFGDHVDAVQPNQDFDIAFGCFKPGLTQLDYIRGLVHADGLQFISDPARKTVTLTPKNEYYNTTGSPDDYTEKVSGNGKVTFDPGQKKVVRLAFKSDSSDKYVTMIEEITGERLYSAAVSFGEAMLEGEEVNENPFFAATAHIRDTKLENPEGNGANVYIPRIWGEEWDGFDSDYPDQFSADFAPRRLYYEGLITQNGTPYWIFEGVNRGQVPTAYQVNYNDSGATKPNLAFSDETVAGGTVTGKLKTHYYQYFAIRRDNFRLEENVKLTSSEFRAVDYSTMKRIKSASFILLKIRDYSPNIDTTPADFVRVVPVDSDTESAVSFPSVDGVTNRFR